MKKLMLTLLIGIMGLNLALASEYEEAMKSQISQMRTINSDSEAQAVKNTFLRIAAANPDEWLPLYYAALTQTEAAFRFEVDKDAYFEEAQTYVEKMQAISPGNSEVTALEGYIMMGIVAVDPGSRGQSMSGLTMEKFGQAIAQDRTNPRAVYLMAQMEAGIARFFGQGPEKACGMFKMSIDLFEKEAEKVDENYILPSWGHEAAKTLYADCN